MADYDEGEHKWIINTPPPVGKIVKVAIDSGGIAGGREEVLCKRVGEYLYRADTCGAIIEIHAECPWVVGWRFPTRHEFPAVDEVTK